MATIGVFLLARIAEDEAVAQQCDDGGETLGYTAEYVQSTPVLAVGSGRVLAECEAKRRIVERYLEVSTVRESNDILFGAVGVLYEVVKRLATVYADHQDYDETWRP